MKTITAAATIITEENVLKKVNRIAPSQESLRNVQRNKAVFFFFLQVNRHRRQKEKEKKKSFEIRKEMSLFAGAAAWDQAVVHLGGFSPPPEM